MPRPLQDWGFGPEGSFGSRGRRHNGANPNARPFALGSKSIETNGFRNWVGRVPSPLIAFFRDPLFVMSDAAANSSPAGAAPGAPTASDSLEVIRKFAETYAQRTGTYFCSDPGVTAVVLAGLAPRWRHGGSSSGAATAAATAVASGSTS
jgi:hypothetical protein